MTPPSRISKPDANGKLSQEQMQQLLHIVADKDIENDKRLRDYTYVERDEAHRRQGAGEVDGNEDLRRDANLWRAGAEADPQRRQTAFGEGRAKEDEKVQKLIDKRKNESDGDRKKREEKEEKDREQERKFVREVADAYNFNAGRDGIGWRARGLGN